jgi:hypothetical protein
MIDPQSCAEPKKNLVFVFYSCYKMLSPPSLAAGCSCLPGNLCSSNMHFKPREKCVFPSAKVLIMPKPLAKTKANTKQQIIAALKAAARKLGYAPTSNEFTRLSGIHY